MKKIRVWWVNLGKKSRLLYIVLAVAVVILALGLGLTYRDLKATEEEATAFKIALQAAEKKREDMAVQYQKEIKLLVEKLDCYLPPELAIEKLARRGDYGPWIEMTRARPGDVVQFKVIIRGVGKNVYLRDILPLGFGEIRNLRVDGEPYDGDISQLYLSNIIGESEITYESRLSFNIGEVTLVNQVIVWADCLEEQRAEVTIEVKPPAPPSSGGGRRTPPKDDECDDGDGPKDDPKPYP